MRVAPAIWFAGALAAAAVAAPVRVGPVVAELVADVDSIAPGQPFTVAFRMALDRPWHTYWINPGDSGLAPTLAWELPAGFTVGELEFPAPIAIATPPFMTYGLAGEVWFLATLTPPPQLPPEGVVLKATAEWLICNEFCVPGAADLELSLPVVAAPGPRPSVFADAIKAARALLPVAPAEWQFRARADDGRFTLAAIPSASGAEEWTAATFFPFDPELLRHAAPQVWRREAAGYSLELAPADPAAPPPRTLAGVLVLSGPDSRRAFRVDASFSEDSPRPTTTERNTP